MTYPYAPPYLTYDENMILDALLALCASSSAYKTYSRKVKLPMSMPAEERPALFLFNDGDNTLQPDGEAVPPKITLECKVFIYTWSNIQDDPPPSAALNEKIKALRQVLIPPPLVQKVTLGGLVSHCWIEGRTIKVPGDVSGDGVAVVPIKILVPA